MKKLISSIQLFGLFLLVSLMNFLSFFGNWNPCNFAVVQNPVTGRMRGKFANAVFTTQFGFNVMKSKALSVANPQTLKQRTQRGKIIAIMPFARLILSIAKVGLRKVSIGMSPFNKLSQNLINDVIGGALDAFTFTWNNLFVSLGELEGFATLAATEAAGKLINITWVNNSGVNNALASDLVYAVGFKSDGSLASFKMGTAVRSAGAITLTCTNMAENDKVEAYVFLTSSNGSLISDSQFLGEQTLQA